MFNLLVTAEPQEPAAGPGGGLVLVAYGSFVLPRASGRRLPRPQPARPSC